MTTLQSIGVYGGLAVFAILIFLRTTSPELFNKNLKKYRPGRGKYKEFHLSNNDSHRAPDKEILKQALTDQNIDYEFARVTHHFYIKNENKEFGDHTYDIEYWESPPKQQS